MELEAVGGIAMGDLALEVGGQVDNGDGAEGAALGADTTTNAQLFGDEGDARLGRHLEIGCQEDVVAQNTGIARGPERYYLDLLESS